MRIALFGVSGRSGQAIVHLAQRRWVEVTGLARPEARVSPAINLTLLRGDLSDSRALLATLDGADAACLAFGPRPPYRDVFCADATTRIIATMKTARVHRLICQSCALAGELPDSLSPMLQLKGRSFAAIHSAIAADRALQEDAVRASGLRWTLAKPCQLHQKPSRGKARAGTALQLGLFSGISREDVAAFVLDELQRPRYLRKAVYLTG
jgi:putative NADH-flavin reductase